MFNAAIAELSQGDYGGAAPYITDDSQNAIVGALIDVAKERMAAEEISTLFPYADELIALVNKHSLEIVSDGSDDFEIADLMSEQVNGDKAEFVTVAVGVLETKALVTVGADDTGAKSLADCFKTAELKNVKIDGDRATATVEMDRFGELMSKEIAFVKVDGTWKIDLSPSFDLKLP